MKSSISALTFICLFFVLLVSRSQGKQWMGLLRGKRRGLRYFDDDPSEVDVETAPSEAPAPTAAPTTICVAVNDLFGTRAETQTGLNLDYDVTVEEGVDADGLNDILGQIDNQVVNELLPSLFPDQCSEFVVRRRLQGGVTGMSSQPADVVVDGVDCQSGGDNCFAVDGGVTIFGDTSNVDLDALKSGLGEKMAGGNFNTIDGVVSVSLRDDEISQPVDPVRTQNVPQEEEDGGNGFPTWAYIVIALAGALCIFITVGIILWNRKKETSEPVKGEEQDTEMQAPLASAAPDLSTFSDPIMS